MHQLEFDIKWNLPHYMLGRLQISKRLIIQRVKTQHEEFFPNYESESFALAYVGVEDDENLGKTAIPYLELFLLIAAITSDITSTYQVGIGSGPRSWNELGTRVPRLNDFEKITTSSPPELCKPILIAKERYLQFEKDCTQIMNGYLGLALRYYHSGIQAYNQTKKYVRRTYLYRQKSEDAIINFAIASEALFSKQSPYRGNLKRRFSEFICKDELEIEKISTIIGDFYEHRGAIVHGGQKTTLFNVKVIKAYLRRAIDKALSLNFYSKNKLLQIIDDI